MVGARLLFLSVLDTKSLVRRDRPHLFRPLRSRQRCRRRSPHLCRNVSCARHGLAGAALILLTGRAVKVGSKVKDIKVGDRVGVGAQVGADLNCDNCKADQENYCPNQ